jgi:hypothetical protein
MTDPRYPIGKFSFQGALSETLKKQFLDDVEQTPARLRCRRGPLRYSTRYSLPAWRLDRASGRAPRP